MGRPRTAKYPRPEESPREEPETAKAVSKADAVRAALAEGVDSPGDIVEFVKGRFGIDMPRQMVSSYKTQEKRREQAQAPQWKYTEAVAKPAANSEPDLLDALEAIKPLIERYGADRVKRIVDLMG